jgi:hypothetical protein
VVVDAIEGLPSASGGVFDRHMQTAHATAHAMQTASVIFQVFFSILLLWEFGLINVSGFHAFGQILASIASKISIKTQKSI